MQPEPAQHARRQIRLAKLQELQTLDRGSPTIPWIRVGREIFDVRTEPETETETETKVVRKSKLGDKKGIYSSDINLDA